MTRHVYTPLSPPERPVAVPLDLSAVAAPRARARRRVLVPLAADLIAAALAVAVAPLVASLIGTPAPDPARGAVLVGLAVAALACLGAYRPRHAPDTPAHILAAAVAATAGAMVAPAGGEPRGVLLPAVLLVAAMLAGRAVLAAAGPRAVPGWRTLIVGAGGIGRVVAARLSRHRGLRLEPVGFLDSDAGDAPGLPVLGRVGDLERVVDETDAEHVVVAFPDASLAEQLDLVRRAEKLGLGVTVVPRLFPHVTRRTAVEHLGGVPLLTSEPARPRSLAFAVKHGVDRVVAASLLVALSPIIAAAAVAIAATMGRPVLFRQLRVGRDGRMFTMLKFRSMAAGDGEDAQRVTRLGRLLRASSVDELPQLLNVLAGHMSLIGPRPEQPHLVEAFERTVYRYRDRHRVKSGITGWAQVHGLGRGAGRFDEASLAERVEWDNYYAENWSPLLDLRIALLTVVAVIRFRQR